MTITISKTITHLVGKWTRTGITQSSIDSLAVTLEQIGSGCDKNPQIDCKRVISFDVCGLNFIYTWLQCLRMRGFEPELINLPDKLQQVFKNFGFKSCFA
jgi:ABC-type transporter Mla MlaB component